MSTNDYAYALLVGVGDYDTFDPSGAANLNGPVNDVMAWLHVALELGIPARHIRLCASPAPTRVPEGVTVVGATHAEIVEGLEWFTEHLDGVDGTKGFLAYSGHGTRMSGLGEVLCPSDIVADGTSLQNALPVAAVGKIIDGRSGEKTRITAFCDTCHTDTGLQVGGGAGRWLPWRDAEAAPANATESHPHSVLGDMVITSSLDGQPSYEVPLVGATRGAMSWAASCLIARWGLTDAAGGTTSRLTYGDLVNQTGDALTAMAVTQTPAFVGVRSAADLRVFSSFGDKKAGSLAPQDLPELEIWPGYAGSGKAVQFTLKDLTGASLGTMILTNDQVSSGDEKNGWAKSTQYWDWQTAGYTAQTFKAAAGSVLTSLPSSGPSSTSISMDTKSLPGSSDSTIATIAADAYVVARVPEGYMQVSSSGGSMTSMTVYAGKKNQTTLATSATESLVFVSVAPNLSVKQFGSVTDS